MSVVAGTRVSDHDSKLVLVTQKNVPDGLFVLTKEALFSTKILGPVWRVLQRALQSPVTVIRFNYYRPPSSIS